MTDDQCQTLKETLNNLIFSIEKVGDRIVEAIDSSSAHLSTIDLERKLGLIEKAIYDTAE